MATPQLQDLPRPGGFPTVQYKRNLPRRGPSGLVLLTGVTAISAVGTYWLGQTILESR
jgi:NADH dehydrogenase (ubiquinone) 1 alpha subcomplex subunit 13